MKVIINGENREIEQPLNLVELLKVYSLPSERIAVELNKKVIRRADWASVEVTDGDRLEVIHFVGGG